jgi:hypothetical protein
LENLMIRITTIAAVLIFLTLLTGAPSARAEMGLFSEGKQSFGLGLGGGADQFVFSGGYGLFVRDGLKPSTSIRFSWSRTGDASTEQLDWEVGARYYFSKPEPISPLAHVFTTVTRLSYDHPTLTGDYVYGNLGVAGGVFILVGRAIGLEVTGGLLQYLGADEELIRADVLPDGIDPFYRLGLSLLF